MKIPEPRRMSSGNYYIYLRLNGVGVPVTAPTAKECKRTAELIKAEYRANKRQIEPSVAAEPKQSKEPTVSEAIDEYLASRQNTLSPSTVRFYRSVQKHRFSAVMSKPISSVTNWQAVVDAEAKTISVKTLRNAFCAVRTAVKAAAGIDIPPARFGVPVPHERAFLTADEIPAFVAAAAPTKYAVPLLLALSSMRVSEIQALDWQDIKKAPDFIQVKGAVVFDEHNHYQKKKQAKNASSSRNVPILIPELKAAIERDRLPSGPVIPCSQNNLRLACHRICQQAGVTDVGLHGLRHSFASLAYHLRVPEQIAMEIGGWSDAGTMRKIYTHIAQNDIKRYQDAMGAFYAGKI